MPHTSMSWCQSLFDRDSRLSSRPSTTPTWFRLPSVISRWKPERFSAARPLCPWSSSTITTRSAGQPSRCANCARAYCRSRDSRFSSTCCGDDCRTYTMARRSRCRGWIFDADLSPRVAGDGAARAALSSRWPGTVSGTVIAHLLIVARCVELSKHDPAEGHQRSLTLFVRQQTPELVECRRLDDRQRRGGVMSSVARDM